ncbi:MAG: DUF4340 domain-containing protein [Oscillospiraceae bacterium]|nr:DUF4340 domain-containing protein [Oscillospiraceae bacterium]
MKKNKKLLIVMVIVLVVIIAAVAAIVAAGKAKENRDQQQAESQTIYVGQLEDLAAVKFNGPEGEYDAVYDAGEGRWTLAGDADFRVNGEVMTAMEEKLVGLTAYHCFDMESEASVYGLDAPAAALTASDSKGNTLSIAFGNLNSGKYYAAVNADATKVYTIASSAFDVWNKDVLALLDLDVLPQPKEKDIESFTITTEGVSVKFTQDATGEEPVWTRTENGAAVPADTDSAYFKNSKYYISSQYFTGAIAYKYSGDGAEYGLDEPFMTLDISCTEEGERRSATLYMGDIAAEDSQRRYCALEGDSNIYIISANFVDYYYALATGAMPDEGDTSGGSVDLEYQTPDL